MNNTIYLTSLNGTLGVCSLMLTTKNIFGATDGKKIKKERTKKKKKDQESRIEFVYEKASITSEPGFQSLHVNTTMLKTFTQMRQVLLSCCLMLNGLHTKDVRSE